MNHTQNFISHMMETGTQHRTPVVGMPVTVNYYTDRRAATVIAMPSPTRIIVQDNETVCINYYASEYKILPELTGSSDEFTLRKNGRWVRKGQSAKNGLGLTIGIHAHYIDPSF